MLDDHTRIEKIAGHLALAPRGYDIVRQRPGHLRQNFAHPLQAHRLQLLRFYAEDDPDFLVDIHFIVRNAPLIRRKRLAKGFAPRFPILVGGSGEQLPE